jgi:hypothetical protein
MNKIKNILLLWGIVGIVSLVVSPVEAVGYSVSFTDPQGDVYDGNGNPTSNPNIDITLVKSYEQNQNIVFEITVAGSIYTGSDEYIYMIHVGGDAGYILQIMYSNDNVIYYPQQNPSDIGQGTFSVQGNKLTIQVPVSAIEHENIVLRVQNAYGNLGGSTPDAIDLAPNDGGFYGGDTESETGEEEPEEQEEESGNTGDEETAGTETGDEKTTDTSDSTPGFEVSLCILAFAVVLVLLFVIRRKNN